jgi:hypothetical protein
VFGTDPTDLPPALAAFAANLGANLFIPLQISFFDADTYFWQGLSVNTGVGEVIVLTGRADGITAADVFVTGAQWIVGVGTNGDNSVIGDAGLLLRSVSGQVRINSAGRNTLMFGTTSTLADIVGFNGVDTVVTDTPAFTTAETVIQSITFGAAPNRIVLIHWQGHIRGTVANDEVIVRIREDNVTGNELYNGRVPIFNTGSPGVPFALSGIMTTGGTLVNRTAVVTGQGTGTGQYRMAAAANRPCTLMPLYLR